MLRQIFANADDAAEFEQVCANLTAQIAKAQALKKQALEPTLYEAEPTAVGINGGAAMGGCKQLIGQLDVLIKQLDALEGRLVTFATMSIEKAAVMSMAYSTAFDSFKGKLEDMHKINANLETISVSILSILSVGAFAWVANFSTTLTTIKDIGTAAVDKTSTYVFSGNARLTSSAKIISPLFFSQLKIKQMLELITATLNICTSLKEQCTTNYASLMNNCTNYAAIYKFYITDKKQEAIYKFYLTSINEVNNALASYNTPIDEKKMIEDFEYAMWVLWIPSLESIHTTYPKPDGMGGYAGRTPNYPMPGKKEKPNEKELGLPKQTTVYDGWLARTVRDSLVHFGIDKKAGVNLDFGMLGARGVPDDQIKKLVKWALSQKITF